MYVEMMCQKLRPLDVLQVLPQTHPVGPTLLTTLGRIKSHIAGSKATLNLFPSNITQLYAIFNIIHD